MVGQATEYSQSLILIGDGPFNALELARFLQRYEIPSHVRNLCFDESNKEPDPNDPWLSFGSASPPFVVLGAENVITMELVSLLSDGACADRQSRTSPLARMFPHWVERIELNEDIAFLRRSRTLRDIEFIPQEMLLAWLFSSCPSPHDLQDPWPAHMASHPGMRQLPALKDAVNSPHGFKWPSTVANPGAGDVPRQEWPQIGLLSYLGYSVGISGKPQAQRHQALANAFYEKRQLQRSQGQF